LVAVTIRGNDATGPAFASVLARVEELKAVLADAGNIRVGLETAGLDSSLMALRAKMQALGIADIIDINVPSGKVMSQLEFLKRAIEQQKISDLLDININEADLTAKLAAIQGLTETIPVKFAVDDASLAKATAFQGASSDNISDNVGVTGTAAAEAALTAMDEKIKKVAADFALLSAASDASSGSLISAASGAGDEISRVSIISGNWFRTLMNIGGTAIPLFGGALGMALPALHDSDNGMVKLAGHLINATNGWHLMTEAVVESLAIWVPATIAAAAFGLTAAPTVEMVGKQLQNMNVAATGTGQAFKSLATQGQSLSSAVRPSVLETFGIALNAIQTHSGELGPDLAKLGGAFDQLAAKAAIAFSSSAGGNFINQASDDLLKLIDSFEAVGSILGSLMRAVPGYAEVLLNFGDAGLHAGAAVVSGIEPVLAAFLKLHGAILYGGLTGTIGAKLFSGLVDGAASASLSIATFAEKFLGSENKISAGALNVGGALEEIGTGPVIAGVGLMIGALTAVVLYLKASKTAADDFNSSIQKTVQNASLAQLESSLSSGVAQTYAKITAAASDVSTAQSKVASTSGTVEFRLDGMNQGVQAATQSLGTYKGGLSQLNAQQENVNVNLGALAATYGTTIPGALALASGAQITSNQLLGSGADNWMTINTMVSGYAKELQVMTPGVGALNQALNALNVTQAAQVTDAQKLAQAYSAWLGIVTGGDSSFATFEQGLTELSSSLASTGGAGATLTIKVGNLKDKFAAVGAAMNGTSTASLAARQAFDQQITSAVTLYGNLQTMAAASGNTATAQDALAKAGKDVVAQMLPLAAGSKEATAEVFALAQIAGFQGVDSFTALTKWVGNTQGAETDLDKQQATLTLSTANLTQAAKNLSAAMSSQLNQAMAQVTLTSTGGLKPMQNLYTAIKQTGLNSLSTKSAAVSLGAQFVTLTGSTSKAHDEFDAFATGSLGLTKKQADTLWQTSLPKLQGAINALKGKTVSVGVTATAQGTLDAISHLPGENPETSSLVFIGKAAGGYMSGPGGPRGDKIPAMLSDGEYVVQADAVNKYGMHFLDAVNSRKYASGGSVDFNAPGSFAASQEGSWGSATAKLWAQQENTAFQAAAKKAATAAAGNINYTPSAGVSQWAATVAQALSMEGLSAALQNNVLYQMSTESGGNPNAINLTDSNALLGTPSKGLMQVIQPTFDEYHWPGTSTDIYNPLANIAAALNYADHVYGPSLESNGMGIGSGHGYAHGGAVSYDNGGWLKPGYTMAYNGTGAPEAVGGSGMSITLELGQSFKTLGLTDRQLTDLQYTIRKKGGLQKVLGG
jgi:hypothetical protein